MEGERMNNKTKKESAKSKSNTKSFNIKSKLMLGFYLLVIMSIFLLSTFSPSIKPVTATSPPEIITNEQTAQNSNNNIVDLALKGIHIRHQNDGINTESVEVLVKNTGNEDISGPIQINIQIDDVVKECDHNHADPFRAGEETDPVLDMVSFVSGCSNHVFNKILSKESNTVKISLDPNNKINETNENNNNLTTEIYIPEIIPTKKIGTFKLNLPSKKISGELITPATPVKVDDELIISIKDYFHASSWNGEESENSYAIYNYEFLNKGYKYTGESPQIYLNKDFRISNGVHTYRLVTTYVGISEITVDVYRDVNTNGHHNNDNNDNNTTPNTDPDTINAYLNKKFSLNENQKAIIVDYKNLNMKLEKIEASVLTEINAKPSVVIELGFPESIDATSIASATSTYPKTTIIIKEGETREFSGVEITALEINTDANKESAVFIVKQKNYLTDYIDIGIDPRLQTVKQGEIVNYNIILQDNHQAKKCEYTEITTPTQENLGAYEIKLNDAKYIDNAFKLEVLEISSETAVISFDVTSKIESMKGYSGKQTVKQGDTFEIKNPYALYKIVVEKISYSDNSLSTENVEKQQGAVVFTIYKTKYTESKSVIKCTDEDNKYTYNLNIIGLPFDSTFEKKIVLNAGEKKTIKLVIDTNKRIYSNTIKETSNEVATGCISSSETTEAYAKCVSANTASANTANSGSSSATANSNTVTDSNVAVYYNTHKFAVKVVQESGYGKDVAYATLNIIPKQPETINGYAIVDVYKYIYPSAITPTSSTSTTEQSATNSGGTSASNTDSTSNSDSKTDSSSNTDSNTEITVLDMDFDHTGTNPNEIIDKSGKNNNGKNINAEFVDGEQGKALNFEADANTQDANAQYNNGEGKSVLIADSNTFDLKTFSIEASIKPASDLSTWPRGYQTIISKEHQYILRFAKDYNTGQHYLQGILFNEGGIKGINYPLEANTFEAGKWYDVKFTYDGNYLRLFINGAQVQEVYSPTSQYKPVYSSAYVIIGNHNVGINYNIPTETYQFIGAIDNVKIRGIKASNHTEPSEPPIIIQPPKKVYVGRYTIKLGETMGIPQESINPNSDVAPSVVKDVLLKYSESTKFNSKTVRLEMVGDNAVVVSVDGVKKTLNINNPKIVNRIRITLVTVFNVEGVEGDSAQLTLQTENSANPSVPDPTKTVFKLTFEKIYQNNIGFFGLALSNTGNDYSFKLSEGSSHSVPETDYIIILKDIVPESNIVIPVEPSEPPKETITIGFAKGWNLVSSSGSNINKFVSSTCDNNNLKGFVYLKSEKKYVTLTEAEKKLGDKFNEYLINNAFWVYSFKECSVTVEIEKYGKYSDLSLEKGWNLMPVTQDMIGKSLNTITSNCDIERAYFYKAENQNWEKINNDYVFSKETDLYKGIIIKANNYCELGGITIFSPPNFPDQQ